jgi:hypothetical protein
MTLPSYRSIKIDINKLLEQISREASANQMGVFKNSPKMVQHEGDKAVFITSDGEVQHIDYQLIESERSITDEMMLSITPEEIIKMAADIGTEMGTKQSKHSFQRISEATTKVGNVVDGSGKPFTMDMFYEVIEKIHIEFDENEQPRMPSIVLGPEMHKKVTAVFEKEGNTEENQRRHEEIMKRKLEEWRERESHRKLVD